MNFHRHLSDRSPNRLKISCWNVNGLSKNSVFDKKLQNCDFHHQFCDCDVSMTEIWGPEVNEIPGFDIITLNSPRKPNTKRSGRSSVNKERNVVMWSPLFDNFFNKIIQFHT